MELSDEELAEILELVPETYREFLDIFHPRWGKETLAPHREYDLKIQLKPGTVLEPAPLYELGPEQVEALRETLERERAAGRIRPSNSPYGSPTFFVPKKDGKYRMVVDYRKLNNATIPDAYPLPLISQIILDLSKSKWFSKFDLPSAYQLLRMAKGFEKLTAFRTQFGMFESTVVRDGLRNAPAGYQHFLNELFAHLLGLGVIIYIDDIIVHARSRKELRRLTRLVFKILRKANLYLNAKKCEFEREEVKFLGFMISAKGVRADTAYVQGVVDFPVPRTLRQCRSFVGLASYYRRFVKDFSRIARPLNILTGKNVPFIWGDLQQRAFETLKTALTQAPVLAHFNPEAETLVQTDASHFGWGFVISQIDPVTQLEHPVVMESGTSDSNDPSKLRGFVRRMGFNSATTLAFDSQGLLRINGRIYIPDNGNCRAKVINAHHDSILAGHPGVSKTHDLIQREYCWLGLRRDVELYIKGCAICQRNKPVRQKPHGLLQSLEVPNLPWSAISMDFVEELPKSKGYNSILVVVDRLTKWAVFIPTTTKLTALGCVDLIVDNIITQHGLPSSIVSDRGSKFTSRVWDGVCKSLGIKASLSTAWHPQTDGQTERVNQVLEQYLRIFTSYKQDNWSSLLSLASFSYNNSVHSAIKMSPFFANYGYDPRWVDQIIEGASHLESVVMKVKSLQEVHELCKQNIEVANEDYARYYNEKRREDPGYKVGDQVLLNVRNMTTKRPMKKLDIKWSGPYTVSEVIGDRACRLELPDTMRVHPVFNVILLRHFTPPQLPGQSYEPPGPVEVDEIGENYEVERIIDSRIRRNRLEYQVEWLGYKGTDEHVSWEPAANLLGAQELVAEFHRTNPDKPRA
nr:uncharacterized protein CI109_007532 [Kwoniella shandongensis]KAA5524173.1 hypothetical protein CI109_007532 [Kwoniella shandongensis]